MLRKSVKGFERSIGLDAAQYKNVPFLSRRQSEVRRRTDPDDRPAGRLHPTHPGASRGPQGRGQRGPD